jgi:hypothetical protein
VNEAPKYNIPVDYSGGTPRFIFLDNQNQEIEIVEFGNHEVDEIKSILRERGFLPLEFQEEEEWD